MCEKMGIVVDVYISPKLSSFDKRYGFIRFALKVDVKSIAKKVWELWIGSFKLFAYSHMHA